jgi:phage-related protein
VRREFDYFDDDVITQEFEDLPAKDAANLIATMDHYETVGFQDPKPAKVQDYGDGARCIRHIKSNHKRRVLFYVGQADSGYQKLWILTVYKKETQEVPKHVMDRARARKTRHEAKQRADEEKRK